MKDQLSNNIVNALNIVPSCLMIVSSDFLIISLNDYFKQRISYTEDQIVGKELGEVLFEIPIADWLQEHARDLNYPECKRNFSIEFPEMSYNTTYRDNLLESIIINFGILNPFEKGGPLISERQITFQSMTDDSDILISIVDDHGKLEYRNPAWERFIGDKMPVNGKFRWEDSIHQEDFSEFHELLKNAIHGKIPFSAEFRIMNKEGIFRWLKIKGTPRFNSQNIFAGFICTAIDISDLKQQLNEVIRLNHMLKESHAELTASKEELQSAFDAAELGSCSLDIATLKAEMSVRYRQLYGLPLEGEINWEMVTEAVEPEYRDEVNRVLAEVITKGKPVDSTYPIRHLISGERKWMRVVGRLRTHREGLSQSIFAVVMDVTRHMEEELRKNDFITMISHELKTPLTSIGGFMQLLIHKSAHPSKSEFLSIYKKIQRQLIHMNRMIEGFLNISKLEMNKMEIVKQEFDFAELMNDFREEYLNDITTHHIITSQFPSIILSADKYRLEMVIHNLVSNAIKYSPEGLNITIHYEQRGQELFFSVTDQGIGIMADEKDKLFERYFRSRYHENYTFAGFGIGLFVCAQIIKMHGGNIWAENNARAKGAIFTFSLHL